MSTWALRFLLCYLCVLFTQPQNRFYFLYPLHIADLSIAASLLLHVASASQEGRPVIRFGPATITGLLLMFFSLISLYTGPLQVSSNWNSDIDIIFKNAFVMIMVEAIAYTPQRVWAIQAGMMIATLWWVKGGLRLAAAGAVYSGDRIMGPAVSLIENPNGFAYLMTVMVPLYLYFYQQSKKKWMKLGFLAVTLCACYIIFQTGSRTGLLALIAVGVFLLPKYGAKHKLTLVVGGVALYFIFQTTGAMNMQRFKTLPQSIKSFLFSSGDKSYRLMDQDEQSAWERRMKNRDTLRLILDNPILGVGIQPDDDLVWEKYDYAGGQVHNELLYAGRQMGIVGISLYLSLLFIIFSRGLSVQRSAGTWPAVADLGWTFKMQAVVFIVGGMFSPIPWNPVMMVLVGSSSALWMNWQERMEYAYTGFASAPARA